MKRSKISTNVMKLKDYPDSVFYRVTCDCMEPEHEMTLELDIDDFCFSLHIYAKLENALYWGQLNWFKRQWKRIKVSLKYLFKGYMDCEQEFLFLGEDHIQSFIDALEEGKEKFKDKFQKEK